MPPSDPSIRYRPPTTLAVATVVPNRGGQNQAATHGRVDKGPPYPVDRRGQVTFNAQLRGHHGSSSGHHRHTTS